MESNLEKFIKEHRSAFDDKKPDRSIWVSIENQLDRQESARIFRLRIFKAAAVFGVVLCCGILIGLNLHKVGKSQLDYAKSPELLQLRDAESYYMQQVSLKYNELKDPASRSGVDEDLRQLDIIYQQLKDEMIRSDYANSGILIDAMIRNYKTKIEILENIVNKQNQLKNENESMSL